MTGSNWDEKQYPSDILDQEHIFLTRLSSNFDRVLAYETQAAKSEALKVIPYQELNLKARAKLSNYEKTEVKNGIKLSITEFLLLELLAWFKEDFFNWFDKAVCSVCHSATESIGYGVPNEDDLLYGGTRVELYSCLNCSNQERFPRYNNAVKLLETRKGRCGEWANCFCLILRALGFETRYVLDWTDHVWTEVYSDAQKRWLHCDCCENVCDSPLVYEKGWRKNLTYVIAFSKDEIVDVTWRYSTNHNEVLKRRFECREEWLLETLSRMNSDRQRQLPGELKSILLQRSAIELVEFLCPPVSNDKDYKGRISGALNWRLSRGETSATRFTPYVFRPNAEEIKNKRIHINYNPATDTYNRTISGDASLQLKGYQQGAFSTESVILKKETDWKMVYLCRNAGSTIGMIEWAVDLGTAKVERITIRFDGKTFENGRVSVMICGDNEICIPVPIDSGTLFSTAELRGCSRLKIKARLSGGTGDVAWQHAQLFRQSLDDLNASPFDWSISLQ